MIIDLNLRQKAVVVVGGGREAFRKVDALLSQDCRITVIAVDVDHEIQRLADEKKVFLRRQNVASGDCLREFSDLILVVAATNDISLNRELVEAARGLGCYAYAVDDPEHSDFSHPAVINLHDTVQIAVSTGGKSPLMAGKIRERAEPVFRELIKKEDILQIRLQEKLRKKAKEKIDGVDARKRFLIAVFQDETIRQLLAQDKMEEAESAALRKLDNR
ncbi:MAG: bifunctional precorrin-2 dehydrogenase/sirohydrochlorin ferrochelatase [Nitrospinota bacterium]|nr:bifunctional precorrin-2 dehydrogenase/sirohydrochlorin ferrochelatase [Nitrospinota bacterium]